jgi:CMP-N-acetylneuraminic acid synthetase
MKIVAFVPIKLNSERLKNKNILMLGNKPLSMYITDTLVNIKSIDEVYVFCSDEKIVNYVNKEVIFLKRSKELDGNHVRGHQIYDSFINLVDADIYILAHTTSPFLLKESIETSLSKIITSGYDSALSVLEHKTFAWYGGATLNYSLSDIPRTQDIDPVMIETSGFYMFKKEVWIDYRQRIGKNPWFQSVNLFEAIDIDEKQDFDFALFVNKYLEEYKNV